MFCRWSHRRISLRDGLCRTRAGTRIGGNLRLLFMTPEDMRRANCLEVDSHLDWFCRGIDPVSVTLYGSYDSSYNATTIYRSPGLSSKPVPAVVLDY